MMSKIKILISLGKKVFNAVEHSKPISLAGKPTEEFCQRLMKVLNETKAIRSKNDVLVGQKLMDGVTIMKEPTHDSIKLLLERCENISPEFRVGAKSLITTNSDGQMFCSAGQYYVIEDLLKMLECV